MLATGTLLIIGGAVLDVTRWNNLAEYGFLVNIYSSITTFMFAVPAAIWIVKSIDSSTSRFQSRRRAIQRMAISFDAIEQALQDGKINPSQVRRRFEKLREAVGGVREIPEWKNLGRDADETFDAVERTLGEVEAIDHPGPQLLGRYYWAILISVGRIYLDIQGPIRRDLLDEFNDGGPDSQYALAAAQQARANDNAESVYSRFAAGLILERDPNPQPSSIEYAPPFVRPYVYGLRPTTRIAVREVSLHRPYVR